MNAHEADRISVQYPDLLGISSNANGLVYFMDQRKNAIAICGQQGRTLLTKPQIETLLVELKNIYEVYMR